jgi:hypothetical protein
VRQEVAPDDVAEALMIPAGAPVVVRESHMSATASGERWSGGASYYPTEGLDPDAIAIRSSRSAARHEPRPLPVSTFTFIGRSDRFEADYLIQA